MSTIRFWSANPDGIVRRVHGTAMMTHVDPGSEQEWFDLADPLERARWRAMAASESEEPLPLSAYRDRERVIRRPAHLTLAATTVAEARRLSEAHVRARNAWRAA